jgi:hypothetical protein
MATLAVFRPRRIIRCRLLAELQFELWIVDAAEIRTKRVRKQKTDRQDAQLILQLLRSAAIAQPLAQSPSSRCTAGK